MTGSTRTPLNAKQVTEVVADPWRVVADKLVAAYRTGSMVRGLEFVTRIVDAAEEANHHPDVDLRYGSVHLALTTHSAHQLTEADVALANRITGIAAEMALEKLVGPVTAIELAIDAMDIGAIRPFWQAVLGYSDGNDRELAELADPTGRLPSVWFQQMDEARPQRNRIHFDLCLPHDEVHERLQAAITAGGQLLSDEFAPAWWILADPEGNEICLCTWQEQD
ncbi:VOC family protein [Gordonia rubripertincta]|uniref:Putative pterin-4-alpha-carbinolamine dehydratase n=2 Tax=Gordonia rubripertincta TaxID=36822 RepID=A0AAW6RCI2_GORRU|nr:VOC family protein [Gordonia rubripertincta]MBM7279931.1 4a-hydroxytetrahydrobiopterin dehydratase [Gordonia rubripertincta]MDG6780964.1 VOC family protein [Gordonia rubripertincta]NKY66032.1 4a-hydroxytetrahydrobiopterin dehydratase [Gordonia rubripertincta]QMU22264.1 4a-hydroxytetrahydrobiopterin dehydratase [Gordonia rubripertincta]TSD94307.1 4a-hydroxytetrahydrobiopterin dehydratase [Gordonia rubripertincta]